LIRVIKAIREKYKQDRNWWKNVKKHRDKTIIYSIIKKAV
jgi:hypothetical protein